MENFDMEEDDEKWNTKTTYVEYWSWRIHERSYGEHNINFWSTYD